MGLYQRAVSIRESPPPPLEANPAERLFTDITTLPESLEAPTHLFGLLQKAFRLTRAALLLYDSVRMVFAPWAHVGFDETTLHRLRLPLGFNQALNRIANGNILSLHAKEELAEFSRFFSAREFASLSELTFLPFIHERKLIALLLISQTEPGEHLRAPAAELLAEACRVSAPRIHRARAENPARPAPTGAQRPAGAPETQQAVTAAVRRLQKDCRQAGLPLLLVRISLSRAVETILRKNTFFDDFRLLEDLTRIIASRLADTGRVFRLEPAGLLLAITRMPDPDAGLLLHHLTLALKGVFLELQGEPDIRYGERVKCWPADGAEAEELVRQLL